jgi:hypothetical protein
MIDDVTAKKFWGKVAKAGPDECWLWTGVRAAKGYGMLGAKRATHLSLVIAGHERPLGLCALHSCDNPPCRNPSHLRWGTIRENNREMFERGRYAHMRQTHCKRGHPLSGDNMRLHPHGQRECRTCHRNRQAARMLKIREGRA